MKKRLYFLSLLILFANTSYSGETAEQSWVTRENMSVFEGITAFCGVSLLAYNYKTLLLKWLKSTWFGSVIKKSKRSSWGSDESSDEEFDFSERAEDCSDIEKKIEKSNRQSRDRITELHRACHKNNAVAVKSLLPALDTKTLNAKYYYERNFEYRPFSRTREKTALIMACEKQNVAIVEALLSRNDIDLNIQDNYDRTALMIACEKGNHIIVQKLLQSKNIGNAAVSIKK